MKTPMQFLLALCLAIPTATGCAVATEDEPVYQGSRASAEVRGHFDLFLSDSGEYYFNLKAANYEILLSSEGYESRQGALTGVLSVLNNGGIESRYATKVGADGQYYVTLKAGNGHIIGRTEGYTSAQGAKRGIEATISAVGSYLEYQDNRTGARFDTFEGSAGQFYFNLHAKNGEVVLSSEGYTTESAALNGTFSVAEAGLDTNNFEIREASNGGAYLVLKAGNHQIVAVSEVYANKSNATAAMNAIAEVLADIELL